MPTLFGTDVDVKMFTAVQLEFLGTLLFQLIGASTGSAVGVGLTYGVLIYATKHVSGGYLNPALTLASSVSGHLHWVKGLSYIVAQIVGAIVGALLQVLLVPHLNLGRNPFRAPGCFHPGSSVTPWQLLLWEAILTFTFVSVAYAVQFTKPGHGNVSPLAMGLAIWALSEAGETYTGAALNPARVIAPALVFLCTPQKFFWLYLAGEVVGALVAGPLAAKAYSTAAGEEGGDGGLPFLEEPGAGREPLLGTEGGTERA